MLDGRRGIGNGRVFPAGPLRAAGPSAASLEFRYKSDLAHLASARKKYRAHPTKKGRATVLSWLKKTRAAHALWNKAKPPAPAKPPTRQLNSAGVSMVAMPAAVAVRAASLPARRLPISPTSLRMTS